jgi:hypothetical protein
MDHRQKSVEHSQAEGLDGGLVLPSPSGSPPGKSIGESNEQMQDGVGMHRVILRRVVFDAEGSGRRRRTVRMSGGQGGDMRQR